MATVRGSVKMENKDGENQHPCLVPWQRVKLFYGPFVVIVALGEVYFILIQ